MSDDQVLDVTLGSLIRNMALYPRTFLDDAAVGRLVDALEAGVTLPPIVINQKRWIVDGLHRWEAHNRIGRERILAVTVQTTSDADFFARAIAANAGHGRPLSAADRQRCIKRAEELGLEPLAVARALRMPPVKLEELRRGPAALDDVDARPSIRLASTPAGRFRGAPTFRRSKPVEPEAELVWHAQALLTALRAGEIEWSTSLRNGLWRLRELLLAERELDGPECGRVGCSQLVTERKTDGHWRAFCSRECENSVRHGSAVLP